MEQQKQQNMNIKVEESTLYNNNNHNDPNTSNNNHNNHNNNSIDDNTNNMDQQQASSNKRLATKGQWQTPPVGPFFPSVSQQQAQQQPSVSNTIGNLTTAVNVPDSSDDYARALQEAYRRGAAAALSRNNNNINSSNNNTGNNNNNTTTTIDIANPLQVSTINTTKLSSTSSSSNTIVGTVQPINTAATPMTTTNMGVPTPLPFTPDSSNTTMQPLQQSPPSMLGINNQQQQQQQFFVSNNNNIITQPTTTTTITSTMTQQQTQQPSSTTSIQMTEPNNNTLVSSQHRSVSLPDMTTYANKTMNDEETKRLKRLARNRASARLRRLKKKNLVRTSIL